MFNNLKLFKKHNLVCHEDIVVPAVSVELQNDQAKNNTDTQSIGGSPKKKSEKENTNENIAATSDKTSFDNQKKEEEHLTKQGLLGANSTEKCPIYVDL